MNLQYKKEPVAVLGATGMAGRAFLDYVSRSPFFYPEPLVASRRYKSLKSVWFREASKEQRDNNEGRFGIKLPEEFERMEVISLKEYMEADDKPKYHFSGLPNRDSQNRRVAWPSEKYLASIGCIVASNASTKRMNPRIPLVTPDLNLAELLKMYQQKWYLDIGGGVVKNTNCTTQTMLVPLFVISTLYPIENIVINTRQAASGAGMGAYLEDKRYSHAGMRTEEHKLIVEPRKMAEIFSKIMISASCRREPKVGRGHMADIFIGLVNAGNIKVNSDQIRRLLSSYNPLEEYIKAVKTATSNLKLDEVPITVAAGKPMILVEREGGLDQRLDVEDSNALIKKYEGMPILVSEHINTRDEVFDIRINTLIDNIGRGASAATLRLIEILYLAENGIVDFRDYLGGIEEYLKNMPDSVLGYK